MICGIYNYFSVYNRVKIPSDMVQLKKERRTKKQWRSQDFSTGGEGGGAEKGGREEGWGTVSYVSCLGSILTSFFTLRSTGGGGGEGCMGAWSIVPPPLASYASGNKDLFQRMPGNPFIQVFLLTMFQTINMNYSHFHNNIIILIDLSLI